MLRTPGQLVDLSTLENTDMQELIDQMITSMHQAEGIGLAAPQIGRSLRLTVIAGEVQGHREPLILINPVVEVIGTEQNTGEEGCLSITGVFGQVVRASRIRVKAFDRRGQLFVTTAEDLFARVILHEVDHLNGVLFIDRATSITKGQEKLP